MSPRAKRTLKIVALVVGLVLAVPLGLGIWSFARTSPISERLEFAQGAVRVLKDGFVAVTVLEVDEGHVALVDCGGDKEGKVVLAELARLSLGPEAVSTILITHGHPDHIAGCHLFPKAEILVLPADVPLVEGKAVGRSLVGRMGSPKPTGLHVARVLVDGETLTLGRRAVKVFAIPGHTGGSAAFLVSNVLLIGDSGGVLKSGEIEKAPYVFSDDQAQSLSSMRTLVQGLKTGGTKVDWVVPSHTGPSQGLIALSAMVE